MSDVATIIPLADIRLNGNVRQHAEADSGLIESIDHEGLLTPLTVYADPEGDGAYVLLAGHRRFDALTKLGIPEVPVLVKDTIEDRADVIAAQVAENLHREDLTEWELAQAAWDLKVEGLNQTQVAKALSIKKSNVSELQKMGKAILTADDVTDEQLETVNKLSFNALADIATAATHKEDPVPVPLILDAFGTEVNVSTFQAIQSARRVQETAVFWEENGEQILEWRENGYMVVESNPSIVGHDDYGRPTYKRTIKELGSGYNMVNVAIEDHIDLDCHIIWVDEQGSGYGHHEPVIRHWCANGNLHSLKGKSPVKAADAQSVADTKARNSQITRQQRAEKQERRDRARGWLTKGRGPKKAETTDLALAIAAGQKHYDDWKRFADILGLLDDKPSHIKGMDVIPYAREQVLDWLDAQAPDDGEHEAERNRIMVGLIVARQYVEDNYSTHGNDYLTEMFGPAEVVVE